MSNIPIITQIVPSTNNNNNNNSSSNVEDGSPHENGTDMVVDDDQETVQDQELKYSKINNNNYMTLMIPRSSTNISNSNNNTTPFERRGSSTVKYMECLKNHAAAMGGNARDGCGEFMPSGEDGTLQAFKCSACECHRNFHRKLIQGPEVIGYPTGTMMITQKASSQQRKQFSYKNNGIMNPNLNSDSDDDDVNIKEDHHQHGFVAMKRPSSHHHQQGMIMKKRFRTKFTAEQKEKLFNFAEKAGWKIQKLDDTLVHQFCQELGIKRRVLKVWMHNNKHNMMAKKINISSTT